MDQAISTVHLPEGERFDFWRDETTKQHLRYDIERLDHLLPFHAELRGAVLGELVFSLSCLSGVRGRRTGQHVAADSLDHYVLGIPLHQSWVQQGGREQVLTDNQMILFDGARPLAYEHGDNCGGIILTIPRYCLEARLADADAKGLRVAPLNHGIGSMVKAFFGALPDVLEDRPGMQVRETLAEQLISLIALSFTASDEGRERAGPSLAQLRFKAVQAFIDSHLEDADLSPEHIAAALGISRSYLYKLFELHHFSFQHDIRQRRLGMAAKELRNASRPERSITDIALACGFKNMSHFSRCFASQYGESPRAYRARMLKTNESS
jgi:AraC-like DNA-binding protein